MQKSFIVNQILSHTVKDLLHQTGFKDFTIQYNDDGDLILQFQNECDSVMFELLGAEDFIHLEWKKQLNRKYYYYFTHLHNLGTVK